jgi:hypothetical protein
MRRRKPPPGAADLQTAVPLVAQSYLRFVADMQPEPESKAFAAQHSAAKTALSHLEQVMKLAAGGAEATDVAGDALDAARQEMDQEETPADDVGEPG